MAERYRLMCILAHPDDESMGVGPALAKYAAEGMETYLVCATRGERGWQGAEDEDPGLQALGELREAELRAAAQTLGLRRLDFLDYIDGDLNRADPAEAVGKIVRLLREIRPQVVVTFAPDGDYGHPDHIAICQLAASALICAADASYAPGPSGAHRVSKFYYYITSPEQAEIIARVWGGICMPVDERERCLVVWPEWAITTRIQVNGHWRSALDAIRCHKSQLASLGDMQSVPEEQWERFLNHNTFYRAFSLVNGGAQIEDDLFAGL